MLYKTALALASLAATTSYIVDAIQLAQEAAEIPDGFPTGDTED